MATQSQAQYYLGKYDDRVAALLGTPVPPGMTVKVVSPEKLNQLAGGPGAAAITSGTSIYVSSAVTESDLAGIVAYEITHAIQQVPAGGDTPNEPRSRTAKEDEAMAQAIRVKLGLADKSTLDDLGSKFYALTDDQFKTASRSLSAGTFTRVSDYAGTTNSSTDPNAGPTNTSSAKNTDATFQAITPNQALKMYTAFHNGQLDTLPKDQQRLFLNISGTMLGVLAGTVDYQSLSQDELHAIITMVNVYTPPGTANYGINSSVSEIETGMATFVQGQGWASPNADNTGINISDSGKSVASGPSWGTAPKGGTDTGNQALDDLLKSLGKGTGSTFNKAQAQATYESLLISWGLLAPGEQPGAFVQNLIDHGLNRKWSITQFQNEVYQSPAFQQEYPGIFNSDGTLKMTPEAYQQQVQQYQSYAQQAGIAWNDNKAAYLFRNDVSPAEFAVRAQNEYTLESNKAYFSAYQEELKAKGLPPADKNSLFHLLNGTGDKRYQTLWNEATVRYSAEQAGLKFGNAQNAYTNLNEKLVARVAGKGLTLDAETQGFQTLAQNLLTALPMSEARTYGLTKGDLIQAAFGGKHQAAAIQKLKLVQDTNAAYDEARAAPQTFSDQSGGLSIVGGEGRKAQSQ